MWHVTWYDKTNRQTRRASLGTADFEEAKIKLGLWVTEKRTARDERPSDVPLEDVLIRYYQQHARHLPSAEQSRYALAKWSDFFACAMVSEVTLQAQEQFVRWLRNQKCSDGYIQRILTAGKAALNRAYRNQEILSVPYVMTVPTSRQRERRLRLDEVAALFNAIDRDHLFFYCMIAFNTLSRPDAILSLQRSQIEFEDRLIALNPPGRKQTKKYRPVVPITNTLLPWLKNSAHEQFVHWKGKPIASIKTGFRRLRERANLSADVIPYTIRHTMATELRKRGVPPWEVAGMLGHKTGGYKTTEIYAKYDPDYLSKAIEAIDDYFDDLQPLVTRSLRASCVPVVEEEKTQPIDFIGRREWDRTTDHYRVEVVLYR